MKSRKMTRVKYIIRRLIASLKNNFGLKITAFVFAIIVWGFGLVSDNPTREHKLVDVPISEIGWDLMYDAGQTPTLSIDERLGVADVTVKVSIAELFYLSLGDVELWIDLSQIHEAGEHELTIQSSSNRGGISNITPSSIKITTDDVRERMIAVQLDVLGEIDPSVYSSGVEYFPMSIMVEGPRDLVNSIDVAFAQIDISGFDTSFVDIKDLVLLDKSGEEVTKDAFSISDKQLTVTMEIDHIKTVNIDMTNIVIGTEQLLDGYIIQEIKAYPDTIRIAASLDELKVIDSIKVKPINLGDNMGEVVIMETSVLVPDYIKLLDDNNVQVAIYIIQQQKDQIYIDRPVAASEMNEELTYEDIQSVQVTVTGPIAQIDSLSSSYIKLYVDTNGLGVGTHSLPVLYEINEKYPDCIVSVQPAFVTVVIS